MPDLTPEEFRRSGREVLDWVAAYRADLPDRPVRPDVAPGSVCARFPALAEEPRPVETLLEAVDDLVVPASVHWQHPRFFGYFPANASLHSLLGDVLSGGLGTQGMLWSASPAATEVELALLDRLAGALGLHPAFTSDGGGGGVIQDSASSASLVALLAALHRAVPGWREDGVSGRETVYVTAETHSSLAKAVRVAGLGARALREVPCTPGTPAMDPAALAALVAADRAHGRVPALVCATVGTTGTGAVDPVREVIDGAGGAWVHVDAAWAGVAALCPEHRGLLDGVERADSFCADAHKWLGTAFDASLLWVRDAAALPDALSITPEYLRDSASESGAVVDYRDWQVPLGRRFRALKLWAVLHGYGLAGLREHIRGHVALADELAGWVRAEPGFALATPPSLALVCLRLDTDERTRSLLARVNATGRAFLTHTVVDGRFAVRVAIGGLTTTRADVVALWDELRHGAAQVRAAGSSR